MSRRNTGTNDSRRYYEWLDHAETDLRAARILRGVGADGRTVVYHCHQALEKSFKCFLLFRNGRHVDGHNITFLSRQAARADRGFAKFVDRTPPFNRYYIETRYPTDLPFEIGERELEQAFSLAEEVYGAVARAIMYEIKDDIDEDEERAARRDENDL